MSPHFAKAVDPIFLYVLDLLDRISRNETTEPELERAKITKHLATAETKLGQSDSWKLAKYGLVCWIDEVLIDTPWDGQDLFTNSPLEFEFFNSALRHHQFYERAREAARLLDRDALEVFYVCVLLGFRGIYANEDPEERAKSLGIAPSLEAWATEVHNSCNLGGHKRDIDKDIEEGQRARPLMGKYRLLAMLVIFLALAVANGLAAYNFMLP